jgi:GntR family transcriptional regulator
MGMITMFTIDLRSRVPIYEQIKNQVMELILLGALKPDEQLPSIRELARDLQLNVNTVKKAFQDLEADGVIYSSVGRGSFVAENALGSAQLKKRAAEQLKTALQSARSSGLTQEEAVELLAAVYTNSRKGDDRA